MSVASSIGQKYVASKGGAQLNFNNEMVHLDMFDDLLTCSPSTEGGSNILKFRFEELLSKARPTRGPVIGNVENTLRKLKVIIENIPEQREVSVGLILFKL